ncbi:hypothetical protein DDZ13_12125 [Coraliomargarita sinensis]|uniref:Ice-binding protein C-terminal domain-containing protein n=1 Tax=Coraliomargarita sinensis TaxID=2174842 RepID=A0A317ZDM2_9BACT|nr:PEP-CTERM sorting domain-containing protein [Coraliomargarita sinensis]PXA03434.1 hypothetical protein DDZ13_12125 [Coraliomargarita sinensis]
MKNNPPPLKKLISAVALFGLAGLFNSANATTIASWDVWTDIGTSDIGPDTLLSGFSVSGSHNGAGGRNTTSSDGTFGTAFSGASTTETFSLGLNSTDAMAWTFTNNSGTDYVFDSVHFDYERRDGSNDGIRLEITKGGTTTAVASFTNIAYNGYTSEASYDMGDFDITDLSAAPDVTIANGESVTFGFIVFDSGVNTSKNNTNPFDNLMITGSVVPEPSSFALIAGCFGLTCVMLRRRK